MTGHIFIYGEIGAGTDKVSLKSVRNQIKPEFDDYVLHVFSPGGDVFEGFAIYNAILNIGKPVVTQIEGLTASIATLISFAGGKILMNKTAEFMIHNPYISDLKGDSHELRNVADQLDKIKSLLIDVTARRAARNGKTISNEELNKLYDNETWLTSDEALNMGFVDDVQPALKAVAKIDLSNPLIKMEKTEKWYEKLFKSLVGTKNFKNDFTETLEDGTVVVVISEDENWTGKQIATEAGEPLAPGDYTLASGKVITVGDGSMITEVKEAAAAAENNQEDMNKIKELEAQLAAALEGKTAAEAKLAESNKTQAEAAAKIEARFKALEDKTNKEEDEKKKQVGAPPILNRGPVFANTASLDDKYDPMGEAVREHLKSHNLI